MTCRTIASFTAAFMTSALFTGLFANVNAAQAAPPDVNVIGQRSGQTCGTFPAGAARAIIGRVDFNATNHVIGGNVISVDDAARECGLGAS